MPEPRVTAWHAISTAETLERNHSTPNGLTASEAAQRLAANGPNELKEGKRISPLQIILGQFKSLIIWILIAAGVISGVGGVLSADFHAALMSGQLSRYDDFDESRADFSRWKGLHETWLRRKQAYERQLKEHGLAAALRTQPAY